MSAVSGPLHVSSLLRTMAIAPPSRDRHHAAHQLASLDPRQFLANLQAAAANRSPHAIAALKTDMYELNEIFYKLSRAGHDISAAQKDFQMLQAFVSQLSVSVASQPEKKHYTSSSFHHQYKHQHDRTAPVPSSSSPPSRSIMARSRSGSISIEKNHYHTSTRQGQGQHQPQSQAPSVPRSSQAAGRSPSSTSSSYSSSSSSSSRTVSSTAGVLCPTPHRLIKHRRVSAPAVTTTAASMKKVHFATYATVYTIPSGGERGRSSSSPTTPTTPKAIASGIVPPPRPSCVPRGSGGFSADDRSRF